MSLKSYSLEDFIQVIKKTMDNHDDLIFVKDTKKRYRYVNKAYLQANMGTSFIGKTDHEIPDGRNAERYKSADLKILSGKDVTYTAKVDYPDGTTNHFLVSKFPIIGPDDEIIGIYGSGRSVKAQIITQRELRYNLQLIETLLDTIPYPVFIKDKDGVYLRVNQAYRDSIQTSEQNIVGSTDFDLHGPEEAKYFRAKDKKVMKTQRRDSYITTGSTTGKKYLITKDVLHDTDGSIMGIVGIVDFYNDLEEIQEELLRNQKIESISELAGGVAHDLNNILTTITGLSSVMILDEDNLENKKNLQSIYSASKQAADLISKLQIFAQNRPANKEEIKFCKIVRSVVSLVKANYSSSIEILDNYDDVDCTILGDETELSQLIMNLLMNAVEAVKDQENPKIVTKVELSKEDPTNMNCVIRPSKDNGVESYVKCSIQDNGPGINRFEKNKIFDPYFTTKPNAGGRGLGLSIVYGVVSNHNGFLDIDTSLSQGTVISIFLPAIN